jgi:hypothetical protein
MNKMKFSSDIDIDFADRNQILKLIAHTPARLEDGQRHASGVYVTDIPLDPFSGIASMDYKTAESLGYIKLDFLNVGVYGQIKNPQHLEELMSQEPAWDKLYDPEFCSRLIHVGNHYKTLIEMPEAVNSIPRLAMFLSIIRPAKRHLIGKNWAEVSQTIWDKVEGQYAFKRSHSIAYAHLVVVHMNLLVEQELKRV